MAIEIKCNNCGKPPLILSSNDPNYEQKLDDWQKKHNHNGPFLVFLILAALFLWWTL